MMKKLALCVVVAVMLACMIPSALAQDQITLGPSKANSLVFIGDGSGGFGLTLNGISNDLAFGSGIFSPYTGVYSLTQNGAITGTSSGLNSWSINQANPILFDFTSGINALTGNLKLVSLSQSGQLGLFNDTLVANLTGLGGNLSSFFTPSGGILDITIKFSSATNLASLGAGQPLDGNISTGELTPTPEPGSMVLLGSGLLAVGGYLRKRMAGV